MCYKHSVLTLKQIYVKKHFPRRPLGSTVLYRRRPLEASSLRAAGPRLLPGGWPSGSRSNISELSRHLPQTRCSQTYKHVRTNIFRGDRLVQPFGFGGGSWDPLAFVLLSHACSKEAGPEDWKLTFRVLEASGRNTRFLNPGISL
jgi:hypothetical protein